MWEGLGYYSRVRNMQKAAQQICEKYNGIFPNEYEQLLSLPGIGAYTAGAVASIAWNKPYAAVDGNVLRVVTRLTADSREISDTKFKNEITAALQEIYPVDKCGIFTQSLMELGAVVCMPNGTPRCTECPLQSLCSACAAGTQPAYPVKKKKAQLEAAISNQVKNRRKDRAFNDTCGQAGTAKKSQERVAWWHVGTAESFGKSRYSANSKVA